MSLFQKFILAVSSLFFLLSLSAGASFAANGHCSATANPSYVQANTQTPVTVTVTNNEDFFISSVAFRGGNSTTLDVVNSLSGWSVGADRYALDTFSAGSAYPGFAVGSSQDFPITVNIPGSQDFSIETGTGFTPALTCDFTINTVASPTVKPITVATSSVPVTTAVPVNTAITASANFTDPDTTTTHTATWNWGDGNTTTGTVTETNGSGSVSNTHTYVHGGAYTVKLTVTNNHGEAGKTDYHPVEVFEHTATVNCNNNYSSYQGNSNSIINDTIRGGANINYNCDTVSFPANNVINAITADTNYTYSGTDNVDYGLLDAVGNLAYGTNNAINDLTNNIPDLGSISGLQISFNVSDAVTPWSLTINSTSLTVHYSPAPPSPTVIALPNGTINEGDTYTASGSFTDPGSTSWTGSVDYGDGSGAQSLSLSGTNFSLSHQYKDNGTYTITVTITDNQGVTGTGTATVTVNNVAPTVGTITAPSSPVLVNTAITASANFTDPGVLDTHTASWNWGDGNTTTGTVTESNGSGSVSNSHTYTATGVYTITLTVTDKDGGVGTQPYQYVAVYDSTTSFAGGKSFDNPSSASPNTTGKVSFGISAKYNNSNTLVGSAKMNFKVANIDFASTSLTSLATTNGKAYLQGSGTVNGTSGYTFLATGIDGSVAGGSDLIRFRIKDSSNTVIYDSQPGAGDTTDPTTVDATGNIRVH